MCPVWCLCTMHHSMMRISMDDIGALPQERTKKSENERVARIQLFALAFS